MWLTSDRLQAHSWYCGIYPCFTCRHTVKMSPGNVLCCSADCLMCWYVSELNAASWCCVIGSCSKELIAAVVLNTIFFMVRQLLTQREFSSCRNSLNTSMLTSSQVKKCCFLPRRTECRRGLAMKILSVCPSVTCVNCDKTVERSVQIYIPYERTFSLVFWEEEWLVGGDPIYLKFWVNWPPLEQNRRFLTDNCS